jgi:hypothetical protein
MEWSAFPGGDESEDVFQAGPNNYGYYQNYQGGNGGYPMQQWATGMNVGGASQTWGGYAAYPGNNNGANVGSIGQMQYYQGPGYGSMNAYAGTEDLSSHFGSDPFDEETGQGEERKMIACDYPGCTAEFASRQRVR